MSPVVSLKTLSKFSWAVLLGSLLYFCSGPHIKFVCYCQLDTNVLDWIHSIFPLVWIHIYTRISVCRPYLWLWYVIVYFTQTFVGLTSHIMMLYLIRTWAPWVWGTTVKALYKSTSFTFTFIPVSCNGQNIAMITVLMNAHSGGQHWLLK